MAVLLCDIDGGVATVTLNRPEALNALNGALGEALVLEAARAKEMNRQVTLASGQPQKGDRK